MGPVSVRILRTHPGTAYNSYATGLVSVRILRSALESAYNSRAPDQLPSSPYDPGWTFRVTGSTPHTGKTGMGKCDGVVVDAWFTGFAGDGEARRCFCVYLGETEGQDVSSTRARNIAVRLLFPDSDETLRNKAQIDSYAVSKNSIAEPTGGHL